MLITFSGLDGSGKTTQIGLFTNYLKEKKYRFKKLAMYDDISFSGFMKKIMGKDKKVKVNYEKSDNKDFRYDKNKKDTHLVFFRKFVYVIDLLTYMSKSWYYRKVKRRLLIMDRCFYDTLANLFNTKSDSYMKFMLKLAPKADLAVFLDAEPDVAFKRKPEYPPEFYKERRDAYLHIFDFVKGSVVDSNGKDFGDILKTQNEIRKLFKEKIR